MYWVSFYVVVLQVLLCPCVWTSLYNVLYWDDFVLISVFTYHMLLPWLILAHDDWVAYLALPADVCYVWTDRSVNFKSFSSLIMLTFVQEISQHGRLFFFSYYWCVFFSGKKECVGINMTSLNFCTDFVSEIKECWAEFSVEDSMIE